MFSAGIAAHGSPPAAGVAAGRNSSGGSLLPCVETLSGVLLTGLRAL